MDLHLSSLDVAGYKKQPVPNTFIAQLNPAKQLGIILPGYRYSADMAPLHYAGRVLLEQGADLLSIDYTYYRTDFTEQPQTEQGKWLASDVFAACEAALSQCSYEKITLVGKSLGTIAMGHLLGDPRFQHSTCIWLTPLLMAEPLRSRMEEIRPRSLFIIGTADRFHQPEVLQHLQQVTRGRAVILDGVDHSLEIPGDIPRSLEVLNQIVQVVQEFLAKVE